MGFDLKKLAKATGTVEIPVADERVEVEYRLGVITAPWADSLQEALASGSSDRLLEKAAELVSGWDFTEGDEPLPLPSEKERTSMIAARDKLKGAKTKKERETIEKELEKAKDAALASFRKLPLPWVGKTLQACARDASVGDPEDLKIG